MLERAATVISPYEFINAYQRDYHRWLEKRIELAAACVSKFTIRAGVAWL